MISKSRRQSPGLREAKIFWLACATLCLWGPGPQRVGAASTAGLTPEPGEELSGGDTTVFDASPKAFGFPAHNIQSEHRAAFFVGHSFFENNWVVAPASTADRDGLGPIFNARSCSACHAGDGRSRPPEAGQPLATMLMRISVPGAGPHHEPLPDPVYGGQIQGRGIPGVPPEADVFVTYEEEAGQFGDGEKFSLRKPIYAVTNLGYGPLAANAMLSPRVGPAMIGMGLLEAVPEETLRALAAQQKRAGNGIAGHINYVWDKAAGKMAPGRFGWKAEQPTVFQQIATAFDEDIGITSSSMPEESYTAREGACAKQASGGHPEISDTILAAVVIYSRTLAAPERRNWAEPTVLRGKALFTQANCAVCHVPKLQTGASDLPEMSNQTIRPYTDLLVHDLGEGLADHRPVFDAGGRDWRTPPLWGIGLVSKVNGHTLFLHDGRARNLTEAILWHGGEAEAARETFRNLSKSDRDALIAFLESL
jgi:CxxC motif-containing protein (DUF1111 family)